MQLNWQAIITNFGGPGIFLAAVGWLIKTLVSNRWRDIEAFKMKLTSDANSEIERFKTRSKWLRLSIMCGSQNFTNIEHG